MPTREVPKRYGNEAEHRYKLAEVVGFLLHGAHNEVYDFTAANGATSTRFPAGTDLNARITPNTVPVLVPIHFDATTTAAGVHFIPYPSTIGIGYIVFSHLNTASTNQDFKLLLFGD